jgi:pyridoxal phosphate enzyme (YggS family)
MPPGAADIRSNLEAIGRRIAAATARAGRPPDSVRLVAVSKTFPADLVRFAAEAGQRSFGENKLQEGLAKAATLTDLDLDWHLIGTLQSNKARKAAATFAWIESIDRLDLLKKVDDAAHEAGTRPRVLIQVDLAHEATKHGADISAVADLVRAALDARAVMCRGLMTVPPFPNVAEDSRPWFRQLRELRDRLIADGLPADQLADLSMGMSQDFEVAIEEGATIVRVGTAIFGRRVPPVTPSA